MPDRAQVFPSAGRHPDGDAPLSEPCVMVIFGASGDLTRRLLVPALYNLKCDGLLAEETVVLGRQRHSTTRLSSITGAACVTPGNGPSLVIKRAPLPP